VIILGFIIGQIPREEKRMKKLAHVFGLMLAGLLLLAACGPQTAPPAAGNEPYQITGTMDYTNEFINYIFEEHMVALVDMYGFVIRDEEWEIPVASQTLGYMNLDEASLHAEYVLQLPEQPTITASPTPACRFLPSPTGRTCMAARTRKATTARAAGRPDSHPTRPTRSAMTR
jgi:hypothetical protein